MPGPAPPWTSSGGGVPSGGFCAHAGLGQNDLAKIDIRGAKLADVARKYKMHADIERELRWMGPMKEVPERLG